LSVSDQKTDLPPLSYEVHSSAAGSTGRRNTPPLLLLTQPGSSRSADFQNWPG
jgi:hypothetical protein